MEIKFLVYSKRVISFTVLALLLSCTQNLQDKSNAIDTCTSCFSPMSQDEYKVTEGKANSGDVDAAVTLWKYHLRMNDNEQIKNIWLEKAASGGNKSAQFYYASHLIESNDESNIERGLNLLHKLSDAGDSEAKLKLAEIYLSGNIVEKNMELGCQLLIDLGNSGYLGEYLTIKSKEAGCE